MLSCRNKRKNGGFIFFFLILSLLCRICTGVLTGSVLSSTIGESCATFPDGNGGSKTQCQEGTVLQLALRPDTAGGSTRFLFQNTGQQGSSGGYGQPRCDDQNPGTCVGGEPFFVNVDITPVIGAYTLDTRGATAPFGYAHSTCLTRAPFGSASSKSGGPYPDTVADTCGPTSSYDLGDYTRCNDPDDFKVDGDTDKYSECTMMCGIDKQIAQSDDPDFCANTVNSLKEDYRTTDSVRPDREHLTCKNVNFDSSFERCMPNFPDPTGLCPCATGPVRAGGANGNANSDEYAPIIVCKSGTCAGTCGTALKIEAGDWCGGQDPDVCCNVTNPNSLCVNTGQLHRCLKCQPAGHEKDKKHFCYYQDLNIELRCSWYGYFTNPTGLDLSAWCGSGDYVEGGWFDPSYNQADSERYRNLNACNCAAGFVEKIYPVTPLCNTYVIQNPISLEYTITVYFTYQDGTLVPGSTMQVGAGLASDSTFEKPVQLVPEAMTPDGFALTIVKSVDSTTGKKSDDLQGFVVMCNNGANPACSVDIDGIDDTVLPTTNIRTSSPDNRFNPWTLAPVGVFNGTEAKVPLPDQVWRYENFLAQSQNESLGSQSATEANLAAWWFYVSPALTNRFGPGCGQNGYLPTGDSDAATSNRMCNGPIGTCVPGSDTLQYGEAIDPPCNIARDMYEYVVNNGGTYSDNTAREEGLRCGDPVVSNTIRVPKHVPLDWDPVEPQYAVNAGKLYKYKSPSFGTLEFEIVLNIASDFQGAVVTQAGGDINAEPRRCELYTATGTGDVTVSVDNKGAQSAEYTLTANCTQGIVMGNPNGVTFSQAPGIGGETNVQTIPLSLRPDAQLTPSQSQIDAGEIVPACNVSLFPSALVIQGRPLATADLIPCETVFIAPSVLPSNPEISVNGLGETVYQNNFTTCFALDPFCRVLFGGGRNGYFTSAQHALIAFCVIILIVSVAACSVTRMTKSAYAKGTMAGAAQSAFDREINRMNATKYEAEQEIRKENKSLKKEDNE